MHASLNDLIANETQSAAVHELCISVAVTQAFGFFELSGVLSPSSRSLSDTMDCPQQRTENSSPEPTPVFAQPRDVPEAALVPEATTFDEEIMRQLLFLANAELARSRAEEP